jgi:hypothetical protein
MCITFGNNNEFFFRDVIAQVRIQYKKKNLNSYFKNGYSAENFKIESECAFDRTLTDEKSEYCMRSNCEFGDGYLVKNGSHVTFRSKERVINILQIVVYFNFA